MLLSVPTGLDKDTEPMLGAGGRRGQGDKGRDFHFESRPGNVGLEQSRLPGVPRMSLHWFSAWPSEPCPEPRGTVSVEGEHKSGSGRPPSAVTSWPPIPFPLPHSVMAAQTVCSINFRPWFIFVWLLERGGRSAEGKQCQGMEHSVGTIL